MSARTFGRTGLRLPAIGFGCMGLVGWYGTRDDDEARATVRAAVAAGITHLDTAATYQDGANERFLGELLGTLDRPRRELFIASKYGISRGSDGVPVIDNAPQSLRRACDSSLSNLGTDYLDLYYLHRIDVRVPIEDSVGALKQLVQAGKIRHLGLSECSVATLQRAHATHPIAAVQSEYSLWSRDPEAGMLEACRQSGIAFVAYSPLGRGFLAGNFRALAELPPQDVRRAMPRFNADNGVHNAQLVDALREFAARKGCSAAQLALAWVLGAGEHVFVIPGMKRRSHLHENLGAAALVLTGPERAELGALFARLGVRGERQTPAMMSVIGR
jgi:aryl-alcohol dehydrogenase-like predicted oxidoreductase